MIGVNPLRFDIPKGRYLSQYLGSPKRGDVWIMSADTGIGKTTWAAQLFANHGQKVLILTSLVSIVEQVSRANRIDYWSGDGKSFNAGAGGWMRDGGAIIATYDSAEKVAAVIKMSEYVVIFDESHNTAFSGYRAKAINSALVVAEKAAAQVAMSGTTRPIKYPLFVAATPIIARITNRPPIHATMIQTNRVAGFIVRALRRVDLNGRNVLFFNKKGQKLAELTAKITSIYPHLKIITFNADTKKEEAVKEMLRTEAIPMGTLVICTSVFLEGINIDSIDAMIVASPLTVELLHQLASRARKELGRVFVWIPKTWLRNEGKEGAGREAVELVYQLTAEAVTNRAADVISDRAFLAAVDTRSLFEFAELAPKITRQNEGGGEAVDYVVADCIAHARRAAAMSLATAKSILVEYGWLFAPDETWDKIRVDRMDSEDTTREETWERIKDMSYDDLTSLAAKHWVADAKMAREYARFFYELADSEELLTAEWLLDAGRALYPYKSPAAARKTISIINHARNQHDIYKRVLDTIPPATYNKKELAELMADCGDGTLIQAEADKLRWFDPSAESDCMRVLGIIRRYLNIEVKRARNAGGALEQAWIVLGMAVDTLPIDVDVMTRLLTERELRIERGDRRAAVVAAAQVAERVIEPLNKYIYVWIDGSAFEAELKFITDDGAAFVVVGGVSTCCVQRDGRWVKYNTTPQPQPQPVAETPALIAKPTPAAPPAQTELDDSWFTDLAKKWDNYDYD